MEKAARQDSIPRENLAEKKSAVTGGATILLGKIKILQVNAALYAAFDEAQSQGEHVSCGAKCNIEMISTGYFGLPKVRR